MSHGGTPTPKAKAAGIGSTRSGDATLPALDEDESIAFQQFFSSEEWDADEMLKLGANLTPRTPTPRSYPQVGQNIGENPLLRPPLLQKQPPPQLGVVPDLGEGQESLLGGVAGSLGAQRLLLGHQGKPPAVSVASPGISLAEFSHVPECLDEWDEALAALEAEDDEHARVEEGIATGQHQQQEGEQQFTQHDEEGMRSYSAFKDDGVSSKVKRVVYVDENVTDFVGAGEVLDAATADLPDRYFFDVVEDNFVALDRLASAPYAIVFLARGDEHLTGPQTAGLVKEVFPQIKTVLLDKEMPQEEEDLEFFDGLLLTPFDHAGLCEALEQLVENSRMVPTGTSCRQEMRKSQPLPGEENKEKKVLQLGDSLLVSGVAFESSHLPQPFLGDGVEDLLAT